MTEGVGRDAQERLLRSALLSLPSNALSVCSCASELDRGRVFCTGVENGELSKGRDKKAVVGSSDRSEMSRLAVASIEG